MGENNRHPLSFPAGKCLDNRSLLALKGRLVAAWERSAKMPKQNVSVVGASRLIRWHTVSGEGRSINNNGCLYIRRYTPAGNQVSEAVS